MSVLKKPVHLAFAGGFIQFHDLRRFSLCGRNLLVGDDDFDPELLGEFERVSAIDLAGDVACMICQQADAGGIKLQTDLSHFIIVELGIQVLRDLTANFLPLAAANVQQTQL